MEGLPGAVFLVMFKRSMFWPLLVTLLILGIGIALFYMVPVVNDQNKAILWVAFGFIVIYSGAAFYLSKSLPALSQAPTDSLSADGQSITISDVVRSE